MKSILETSVYLFLAAIICYVGIEFVSMNMKVSRVNEVSQYLSDYVEMYGKSQTDEQGNISLDSDTYAKLCENAQKNQIEAECVYYSETEQYIYYDMQLSYNLEIPLIGFCKKHCVNRLVRAGR